MDKNSIDIEISEKVAEEAGKQITQFKKEIEKNKDLKLSILQDVLYDVRDQRKFLKKLCVILCLFVFLAISGIVITSIANQKILSDVSYRNMEKIINFLEKADVTIDTSEIPNE